MDQCRGQDLTDVFGLIVKHTGTDDWIYEFIRLVFDDKTYMDCGKSNNQTSINFECAVLLTCE